MRPHLSIEPARLANEHAINADRVHRLNPGSYDCIYRSGAPVGQKLVQVDLSVDDLNVVGHSVTVNHVGTVSVGDGDHSKMFWQSKGVHRCSLPADGFGLTTGGTETGRLSLL